MSDHTPTVRPGRPSRFQLPTLVGGLLIGGLIMGAVAPLVGSDRNTEVSSTAPGFLGGDTTSSGTGQGAGVGGTVDGGTRGEVDADGSVTGIDGGGTVVGGSGTDAATGGAPGGGATAAAGAGGGAATQRTASDIGITADTITVGSMALNCKACAAFGANLNSTLPRSRLAQIFGDEINARGGIHGRKLVVHTAEYDPAQDAANGGGTEQAACIELTERRKVFAVVVGGSITNACIYEQHKTPMITYADPSAADPDSFNRNEGRVWMFEASSARVLTDFARQIERQQLFSRQTRWGVMYSEEPFANVVKTHLLAEMKRLGYSPTKESRIPGNPASSTVKIAQEVAAMQAAGVTHVIMADSFVNSAAWVREAKRNGWKPQYVVSDYPNGANDFTGGQTGAADWVGTIAISTALELPAAQLRQHPAVKPCVDHVEKVTKTPVGEGDLSWVYNFCISFKVFEQAMTKAGPNPTRRSLVQALATTGEFPFPALGDRIRFGGAYPFGPAQWSGKMFAERKVWRSPCPKPGDKDNACYVATGAPFRMTT